MENDNKKAELEKLRNRHRICVTWSGRYPHVCSGKWEISIDGVSIDIPKDIVKEPMGTYKKYVRIYFDSPKKWNEIHEDYFDGLNFNEWIKLNMWLPKAIRSALDIKSKAELGVLVSDVYDEINKHDWRHMCCGGCL